ncbi:hypothetical protein MUB01_07855 [Mycolicibacterium smegmatis]|nr:hypothetical protein [Mycolicibacterium smegmatis]AIU10160.1 hypothetical protein LJ00_25335 [Mycolicibacterium smegmatis MC2 155]AIU16785.1 hypothetical protein LI99_25340 [Mycolicibacterium smegmatis]AIU23408.1 hypothetical protein LI98_25345 [Mycolicibacterium smegmatis]MCO4193035.1 hypothetical protein [Mycolicibacterium smegmatis]UUR94807.1 hypothetical protein NQ424_24850 [Mycolicibacterium smegmatis]
MRHEPRRPGGDADQPRRRPVGLAQDCGHLLHRAEVGLQPAEPPGREHPEHPGVLHRLDHLVGGAPVDITELGELTQYRMQAVCSFDDVGQQ